MNFCHSSTHLVTQMLNHFYIISNFHLYPFHLGEPKISQALCQDACQYLLVIVSQGTKELKRYFLGKFGRRLSSWISSSPKRSFYHGGSCDCQVKFKNLSHHHLSPLRNNWLKDNHIIGRLLKPHTKNTIFINFAARNTLVAEQFSAVQLMFSVFPNVDKCLPFCFLRRSV